MNNKGQLTNTEKIYILSTGRAGSTYLSKFFEKYYPSLKVEHQKIGARLINIFGNLPFKGKTYIIILKLLFSIFSRREPPRSTVDPLLSIALYKMIKSGAIKGDFKVVHLVREPKSFVTSFMNWKSESISKMILHNVIPFWSPIPFFHGVPLFKWLGMKKYEKFSWIWNYKNQLFNELKADNYFLLKMESITSKDININKFEDLIKFLELDKIELENIEMDKKINKSSKKKFPSPVEWGDIENDVLLYCQPMKNKLKY